MASTTEKNRRKQLRAQARAATEPDNTAKYHHTEVFFVRNLGSVAPPTEQFEVQILDSELRAVAVGYFGESAASVSVGGVVIPGAVLSAARQRRAGPGDFVNSLGLVVGPKDVSA